MHVASRKHKPVYPLGILLVGRAGVLRQHGVQRRSPLLRHNPLPFLRATHTQPLSDLAELDCLCVIEEL